MNKHAGFTLIELLVVVALMAILLALAVPNFRTLVQNTRATSQANELLTLMQYARSEALKRGAPVSVCSTANAAAVPPVCGGTWATGWLAYVDTQAAGSAATGVGQVLRVWQGIGQGTAIPNPATIGAGNFLRFLPAGQVDPDPAGIGFPVVFQLTVADCGGDNSRDIAIARTGRVSIVRANCP